jgi:hypothetical protein
VFHRYLLECSEVLHSPAARRESVTIKKADSATKRMAIDKAKPADGLIAAR